MNTVIVRFKSKTDGHVYEAKEQSNNIPMGVAKAQADLSRWCRRHNWDMNDYKFLDARMIREETPSISEIDHRIRFGRAVSGHDMNRWVRSPKGMMTVAMMNAAGRASV